MSAMPGVESRSTKCFTSVSRFQRARDRAAQNQPAMIAKGKNMRRADQKWSFGQFRLLDRPASRPLLVGVVESGRSLVGRIDHNESMQLKSDR